METAAKDCRFLPAGSWPLSRYAKGPLSLRDEASLGIRINHQTGSL